MPLTVGSRLGPYEIVAAIGAGGMGEVYRARDTKLQRDVAVKVLPDAFAADPERVARFEREATALAALSHPNIAAIFGVEESQGVSALVLELVEGPTLADRIALGPLPLAEAIALAVQIVDALEAAHDRGIIHRDLKPANIKVRDDGTVKVLDFGLAKMLEAPSGITKPELTASPTVMSPVNMTNAGVILGTAAYMAPEQAKGRAADRRSDVWAFGCVLYEMLAGRRAFDGTELTEIIASVLRGEPDWTALPADLPVPIARLLRRCLEKDRAQRLHDISTARFVLTEYAGLGGTTAPVPASGQGVGLRRAWTLGAGLAGLLAGGLAVAVLRPAASGHATDRVARFELSPPAGETFSSAPRGSNVAISPDGASVVYTAVRNGTSELVLRRLDRLESHPIAGTEGAGDPFFSPDGEQVGFISVGELKRVPVQGGSSVTIWHGDPTFEGASWGADNTIVFGYDFALYRIPATGGRAELVAAPDPATDERAYDRPAILPGGRAVLYTVTFRNGESTVAGRSLDGGAPVRIVDQAFGGLLTPSGYLVYGQSDRLMAVRFDPQTLKTQGAPSVVEEGVFTKLPASNVAIAADGSAVYVSGHDGGSLRRLVWVDRHGTHGAPVVNGPLESARNPRLSPDGRKLVVVAGRDANGNLWVYDLAAPKPPLQLTFRDHNTFPVWSPDGRRIAFMSVAGPAFRVLTIDADGSALQADTLVANEPPSAPLDWSPDGASMLMHRHSSLWLYRVKDHAGAPWLQTPFGEFGARFSPDGRWVAYASNQAGRTEIWVRPFPGPGAPVRVSSGGGHDPVWSRDGRELFFTNGATMMSARVLSTSTEFRAEDAHALFQGGFTYDTEDLILRYYDVAADGRFVMIEPPTTTPVAVVVAPHWDQGLSAEARR